MITLKLEELLCINNDIDLEKYTEFREYVKTNMAPSKWIGDFSKEDLRNLLNNNSNIWDVLFR